jgi:hypothetical protein
MFLVLNVVTHCESVWMDILISINTINYLNSALYSIQNKINRIKNIFSFSPLLIRIFYFLALKYGLQMPDIVN